MMINGASFYGNDGAANVNALTFSTSGNTLKWYSRNVIWQLNGEGQVYNYSGIG